MAVNFIETSLKDCYLIEPQVFGDERGFFLETFRQSWFDDLGVSLSFVQDNHSRSSKGVLRGLHYQIQQPQGKLVRVTEGAVFDVAVDLRQSSPTFGQWVGYELSADNKKMLWVPPGFAHGFYVLSDQAQFLYKCTAYYCPEFDRSLRWDDPELAISWPLEGAPQLSDKDKQALSFAEAEKFS